MTHLTYSLTCDCCNKREFSEGDESQADVDAHAMFKGWTKRKVHRIWWDYCPCCTEQMQNKVDLYTT